jgi:hypothetical protein
MVKTIERVNALIIDSCLYSRKGLEFLLCSCGYKATGLNRPPSLTELYRSGGLTDVDLLVVRIAAHPSLYFSELSALALLLNGNALSCRLFIITHLQAGSCYNLLLSYGVKSETVKKLTIVDARLTVPTLQKIIVSGEKKKPCAKLEQMESLFSYGVK